MQQTSISTKDLKDDFRVFLVMLWKFLRLPKPNPVQLDMAYTLQHGEDRMILQAYRGAAKSWITAAYVIWRLYNNPMEKILVVSANYDRASDFSVFVKQILFENPILKFMFPRTEQRSANDKFDVAPAGLAQVASVTSIGIGGNLTGKRASIIIGDDIEVVQNSYTADRREKVRKQVEEFPALIADAKDARVLFLGTPQVEETLYDHLVDRGYTKYIYPARYPTQEQLRTYKGQLGDYILKTMDDHKALDPVDPWRFPESLLVKMEAEMGRSGFQLQFMLDTSLSDADRYPLKFSDLIVMPLDREEAPQKVMWSNGSEYILNDLPAIGFSGDRFYRNMSMGQEIKFEKYTEIVMSVDPSGRGTDETGYAIVGYLNGQLFLLDGGGLKGGFDDDTLKKLSEKARDHNVTRVIVEENFGGGSFTKLFETVLQKYHRTTLEEVRHHKQKELRIIDTLEPIMNRHKLIVSYDLVKKSFKNFEDTKVYNLFYQMTRVTKERGCLKHDDALDALSMAVAYYVEKMNRDTDRMIKMKDEKQEEEYFRKFLSDYDSMYVQKESNYISEFTGGRY